ncbi:MAG: hypothetical protein A2157_17995 [Deltaproteobacteria bacterium RBG_16_47_11]|nr:MAG: hypothetical protein A2157_17995 [Deltaproteobacteria bacterium RBG_16_47_11]
MRNKKMGKRIYAIIFSLIALFCFVSSSGGFESNANKDETTPNPNDQRPYTRDNAVKPLGQGGYHGGHDTITAEGMLLKKGVHRSDPDSGEKFNTWADREALPDLRTGAHDEDTSLQLNGFLNDPPIGPNGWGDFFQHFYNPDSGTGLKNVWNPATKKAKDYISGVKIMLCKIKNNPLDKNARERLYDFLGRIMHLLQDMATPSHTKNDIHVFTKPFESYVNDHWNDIINSDAFKNTVTPQKYLEGNYGNLPNVDNPVFNPDQFMKTLANISRRYYSEEKLIDLIIDPYTGALIKEVNTERLMKNVNELIPEAVKNTAGYINAIYDFVNKTGSGGMGELDFCNDPPDPPSPANDHPDDRFDVSDEFYWEKNYGISEIDLTDFYLRAAIKKGKIGVWYKKRFMEIFIEGRTIYKDAPQETKDAIEREFQSIGKKLEQRINQTDSDWKGAPDVALFANGFYNPSISLMLKIGELVSFRRIDFDPAIVRDHPVMLVPTGGFYGLKNSTTVKVLLDEYVKNGGTLVLFAQQHGYDWDLLPVPVNPETGERKPVIGYGYQEDQSCQFNSVYIDTYHPILSEFSTSTANIGVDGYFSSYPDNSTILLRRVSNGQPAMIMYPYGNGYVIATTMYTDFAFTHSQTNQTEINFIQNIISWAKKPEDILEVRPGQAVDLNINVSNFMDTGAASLKFTILDPSRKVISEQTQGISLPAGQSATIPATHTTTSSSVLGIYHIDYILYDSSGTIIQPQAETDSGRFVVSNPPSNPYKSPDFGFSVQSDAEYYVYGTPATFTFILWNHTDRERQITVRGNLSHHRTWVVKTVTIPPRGNTQFTYILERVIDLDRCFTWFYDESNKIIALESKGIWVVNPSADVTVTTDKHSYAKGETVAINVFLKNNIALPWQPNVDVTITDYSGYNWTTLFKDSQTITLPPSGNGSVSTNFTLPTDLPMKRYVVQAMLRSLSGFWVPSSAYTWFEVPQSQIIVTANPPSTFSIGNNTIPFAITNAGKINVNSATFDFSLKAPDGSIVFSGSQPVSLAVGETKTLDIPIFIASLKNGNYILAYTQSDETRTGNPTYITIPNSIYISPSFDKPSYRARETANLKLDLKNTGKFNLNNLSLEVSAPDANYTDTQTISLGVNTSTSLNFTIPIPETISAGLHNVDMLLTLPGGTSVTKQVGFVVAESALSIKYQGAPTASAGDTLSVVVENTGGVDTQYDSYIYLFDNMGFWMETNTGTGFIQAGTQGNMTYTLPDQLIDGGYTLRVEVIDEKTSRIISKNILLGITGLSGEVSVRTDKDIYFSNEETMTLSTVVNQGKPMVEGNLHLEIACSEYIEAPSPVSFHIYTYTQETYQWTEQGVLHFPGSYEQRELPLPISPNEWGGAYLRIQHEGAQSAYLDYLALRDSNGNIYSPSFVGAPEQTDITSEAQGIDDVAAWVTGQTIYASWENLPLGTSYTLVMVAKEGCGIVWETDTTINQGTGVTDTLNISAGNIGYSGKFYLRGELTNSLGESLGTSYYPFYIIDGDTVLLFNTDKRIYKPGETITITGKIENRAPITAENLTLTLNSARVWQSSQLLLTETINLLRGGNYPFTITTTAEGEEGAVTLSGAVKQNNEILVRITDQYEVANPLVSAYVDMPEMTGNEPFTIEVDLYNDGKVDATVQFGVQSSELVDSQTITIPAFGMKLLQYSQQISKDVTYTFTFAGDYQETTTKTVTYGLGASIQIRDGSSALGVFPEGNVAIPVTITNTGQSTETLEVTYQLNPGAAQQSKTYSLPVGGSATDTLYFDLTEGDYQISATSQKPDASAQASLSVRKENQVQMGVSLGTQTDGLVPVTVNLTNGGFNEINGSVSLSVTIDSGQVVWSGEEALSQLAPQNSQLLTLNINPSAIDPGNYNVQVTLLSNSNQPISIQSLALGVQGATFQITQLPPYQTFNPGQEATFTFRVRNTGNQEGSFELRLKAYDLIDSTQREWLKPNEEKAVTFGFMLPEDLEEKDYFADYELKASVVAGQSKGQIKYHLAGISLNVNASLDKPYYTEGETAHLTINIQTPNPAPQNLFARVNYAGYEPQQTFTLSGNQVLIFDIPLPKITGEKFFYGIYHEGGRSIHLNSVYIHKAGDVITITTNKQVYNTGETVSVSVIGSATGDMTLSAPGGYTETFTFTGSAAKSFTLPATITAGTYFISYQLSTTSGESYTGTYPFDAAGIQVKVLECNNNKGKYASSDTIATSFTISSNTTMPAILKAWIVDPTGQYTSVGEQNITLSSSESFLITYNSALNTSVSGIHRLVYGIYGPEDLLLCSGSEAFDVGDGVLMGISTDKKDYPTNTEPVTFRASLYGSVSADLQLELDGTLVKIEPVSLNGFTTYTTELQNIIPGPHTLKGTLIAGGLKSTKETSFTYALAYMPKPQISASPGYLDFGSLNLGSTSTKSITLSSTGNVDLVVGTIGLSGTNQGEFSIQNDNCSGRTITPSGNCTLDILFSPTSLGSKSALLSIPSNALDTPTLILSLGGAGATTLNLSINPGGSGRVTGTGIDCPGDCTESFSTSGAAIQLTATPSEGYVFTNWTGDINVTENPVTVNMDTHKNVTANFGINAYTINVTVSIGGTITPSGSVTVNPGGSQTFTITPNAGYHVTDVRVNGVSVGAVTTYTFNNLNANHSIEVSFAIDQYTLIATAGPNGTIIPSGPVIVDHGGSLTFTMTPNTGYRISDVKVDGGSIGAVATYTFTNVTASHTIEASFVINQHTITATAGSNGTITPSGPVTVDHGGSQTFTITPNTGYRISDVVVDGGMLGVTRSYTFNNVTSDHTISATFKEIQVVSLPFSDNFDDDTVGTEPDSPWDNFNGGPAIVTGSGSHSPANSISVSSGPEGSGSAFVNLRETYPDRIAYEVWAKVNSTASGAYIGFSEEILGIMPQFNAVYFNGTDGKVYFTSADKDHGFKVPLLDSFSVGVWRKVRVQIDFLNLIADVFIDDVHVGSGLQVSPKDASWEYEGTHSFQLNKIGVTHALGEPFYFDDFSVSEWNPYTPLGLLRSAGPGQWAVLGMGGIGSASSTSVSMSGSSSVRGTVANTGVANAGNVNMSGSSRINGTLSLNTAGRLNKSGTSAVAGGVRQNTATDGVLDQAVADALAASQSAAALPATITSMTRVTISNPSQNITITGGTGTNVLHITNIAISNGTLTLSAPHGGSFIMNVSGSFALSGASRILLAGGITPPDVLYNFVGSGGSVAMSGGASVTGILLAPQRGIALSSSTVTGEIISGGSGIAFSGTAQVNNPGP